VPAVDDLLKEQDDIMLAAGDGELSEDQVSRYEELETQLAGSRKREELVKRHAATRAAATPIITSGAQHEDDEESRSAWDSYMRTGHAQPLQDLQKRAQSEMVGSEGGFTVPTTFRNKIVERLKAYGGLANVVENYTTGDGSPVRWVTIDDTSNVGEIVAENQAPVSGADLVFGEATLGAYKYMSVGAGGLPLRLSVELVQDSAFDIEGKVSTWLGRRMMRQLAVDIVSGSGAGEPLGIITGKVGIPSTAGTIVYKDLVHYIHSIDPDYRDGARWAFNDASLEMLRGIVDANGRPILTDANAGIEGSPGGMRLLGYPVTIDQAFPNFAANTTTNWGVFGQLDEAYVLRRVKDLVVVVDPYTRALNGQIQYTAWMRADGTVQNPYAYVALSGHA
jgi:HK97 family phage major capsid protein